MTVDPGKPTDLEGFMRESLAIEGIHRRPSVAELAATRAFLALERIDTAAVCQLQAVYAPGMPLRLAPTMNVRVGSYTAPRGGPEIGAALQRVCDDANERRDSPWGIHVTFEKLHPFMDGNGRTGRTLWAWYMQRVGLDPFALPFLHRFYYQTLAAQG